MSTSTLLSSSLLEIFKCPLCRLVFMLESGFEINRIYNISESKEFNKITEDACMSNINVYTPALLLCFD